MRSRTCAAAANTVRNGTRPGTKLKKQNVFDDFIAAAEFLIREKYTNPKRLAILGRSNGGLLVGAALTQRPELFGAALPGVGVMDMLRYHTASANARQWSSDFGISENAAEFQALRAYSPVHNVKAGTCYPPTLVTTADRDDRVVPWHSYKFAAELQRDAGLREPGADPHRDARRPWRRQAGVDADRGHRRPVRLRRECARDAGPAS